MKKKLLLTSILSIVMCLSLICGATFALFTSTDKVNVAVTSGKVKVTATVENLEYKTYTTDWTAMEDNKTSFDNIGGSATLTDEGNIVLDKIVPGDGVRFDVKIENESTVTVKYRTIVKNTSEDSTLFDALSVSMNEEEFAKTKVSAWTELESTTTEVGTINLAIELPEDVDGEEVMGKSCTLEIVVEAIQGNATPSDSVTVSSAAELKGAIGSVSEITLSGDIVLNETLVIDSDTKIVGNGATITRADGFTGTVITVSEGVNFELQDVTVDGGAVWENEASGVSLLSETDETVYGVQGKTNTGVVSTGNLIVAGANSNIVLGKDVVLENVDGKYVIDLGTRIGATLTIDGAEIVNNSNGAGAIWGGGNIIMNSGKINGNYSTDLAGAIRMVSSCNFTMNGGEINYNSAANDGGVIWGYGSSTYTFTGGEMAYNQAGGVGGAIYTGTYSVMNISGDFEMHDNSASNSGAIRFTDHSSLTMTGGKIYNNTANGESNCFNTWNNSMSLTGGEISDNISYVGGLWLTVGEANITGEIAYDLSTNHNTAYLAEKFNGFKFRVNEGDEHFANFNFKPADGYEYVEGDEDKLVCLNEGYVTYWDTATSTFRLQKA